MSMLKLLFSYKGRTKRLAFWQTIIFPVILSLVIYYFIKDYYQFSGVITIIGLAISTWLITAGICKRLHDLNYSGWLQLLFFIPAIAVYILSLKYTIQPSIIILGFFVYLAGLWILLWVAIISGSSEENRFSQSHSTNAKSQNKWIAKFKSIKTRKKNKRVIEPYKEFKTSNQASDHFAVFDQVHQPNPALTENNQNQTASNQDVWLDEEQPEILRSTASIFNPHGPK